MSHHTRLGNTFIPLGIRWLGPVDGHSLHVHSAPRAHHTSAALSAGRDVDRRFTCNYHSFGQECTHMGGQYTAHPHPLESRSAKLYQRLWTILQPAYPTHLSQQSGLPMYYSPAAASLAASQPCGLHVLSSLDSFVSILPAIIRQGRPIIAALIWL